MALNSFVAEDRKAVSVKAGTELMVLDYEDKSRWRMHQVEAMEVGQAACVELETESGITLIVSSETPLTLQDNAPANASGITKLGDQYVIPAKHGVGVLVPVFDRGEFRWERVAAARPVGDWFVAHIHIHGMTYAAGRERDRYIFTHNPGVQKP